MKYFKQSEFECKCGCTGNTIDPDFAEKLDTIREICGFPFTVTSGFRCLAHNKAVGGHPNSAHCRGLAVDILASGVNAARIIAAAHVEGFTGVGVSQKGSGRFIHLDISHDNFALWSY